MLALKGESCWSASCNESKRLLRRAAGPARCSPLGGSRVDPTWVISRPLSRTTVTGGGQRDPGVRRDDGS
ncbi:MAG: hypothetical protein R2719_12210 [Micropruina sp.]